MQHFQEFYIDKKLHSVVQNVDFVIFAVVQVEIHLVEHLYVVLIFPHWNWTGVREHYRSHKSFGVVRYHVSTYEGNWVRCEEDNARSNIFRKLVPDVAAFFGDLSCYG